MNYKKLPDISEKQKEIIEHVFKFRFINRKQIQTILNHKDARRINAWLKDLVTKKYLGRIYSHKLIENTKPAIYYLANNGILWCKGNMAWRYRMEEDFPTKEIKKFYEDKNASDTFRKHSITICDLYLQIKEKENMTKWKHDFLTKTELWTINKEEDNFEEKKQYIPDVFLEKYKEAEVSSKISVYFLFDYHVPSYALKYKVRQFIKFHDERDWEEDYGGIDKKFPEILFILENGQKLYKLSKYIQETLDESYDKEDIVFKLTTTKKLKEEGIDGKTTWKTIKSES